jgi:tRNA(Ile)-lysidine synthase
MAEGISLWGNTILRPFLNTFFREELRGVLSQIGQDWTDDPTNDDPAYDRVKARRMLDVLAPLGLTRDRLVQTAGSMARARDVLDAAAAALIAEAVTLSPLGYATMQVAAFRGAAQDTRTRAFARLLCMVSGTHYRPDYESLLAAFERVAGQADPAATTLHGCILRRSGGFVAIIREPAACDRATRSGTDSAVWDGRFTLEGRSLAVETGLSLRMVGEAGLRQIPKDCETVSEAWKSAPREARITSLGLWHGETLVAVPLAPWSIAPDTPSIGIRTIWP